MALFGFGKKKDEASPCCSRDMEKARFLVLGACCRKSAETFANVKQAVEELGLSEQVLNVGDAAEIARYGVLQTPALVIDAKVVSYGKLIRTEEAKKLIEKAMAFDKTP